MPELRQVPAVILTLVLVGLIFGAGLLSLTQFQSSIGSFGTTNQANTSNGAVSGVFGNTTLSINNFASQMPVIGTLLGVGVLVVVVMMAFAFGGRFTSGGTQGSTGAGY